MAYEESKREAKRPHKLSLNERRELTLCGVEEVESFDEKEVLLVTSLGLLRICGEGLNISRLSIETGEVDVSGSVSLLQYEETAPSGSLWARLFH